MVKCSVSVMGAFYEKMHIDNRILYVRKMLYCGFRTAMMGVCENPNIKYEIEPERRDEVLCVGIFCLKEKVEKQCRNKKS